MAVALRLPPSEVERVAEASPELLDAMRAAEATRWTTERELLAGIYELTHANMRLLAGMAGVHRSDIPKPIRVPRPHDNPPTKTPTASGAQLRQWMTARGGST